MKKTTFLELNSKNDLFFLSETDFSEHFLFNFKIIHKIDNHINLIAYQSKMGNDFNLCERNPNEYVSQTTIQDLYSQGNFQKAQQKSKVPPLSQELSDLLASKKPFLKQLNQASSIKKVSFNGNTYIGEVSALRTPHGWGKMYCLNGDIVIGQFNKGNPQGNCFYSNSKGLYYQGILVNGKLNCNNGVYYGQDFQYIGGFKDNQFHGKGKILKANYVISGQFNQGKIRQGKLQWRESSSKCYTYKGEFDQQMQMSGQGVLQEPFGTYTGEFKYNKKHGKGQYQYKDRKIFRGNYANGLKEGEGELISRYQQIIYKGQWKNDIPVDQSQQMLLSAEHLKSSAKIQRTDTLRSLSTVDA